MLRRSWGLAVAGMCMLSAAGALAQDAPADKWQAVAKTDTQEAFVSRPSIVAVDGMFEARARQEFTQPPPSAKKDKTFLSSRTTFRVDCSQRRLAIKEIRAYAGNNMQGDQVQKMTSGDKYLQWMAAPPDTVYGRILDFVCLTGPAG